MDESDQELYLGLLGELSPAFGCSLHAYVLMTNHVHLLVTPERMDGLSLLMKHLGQRYVQYINRTHGRTGSLWEGRFRSSIVDSEAYLLRCYRYIELNPVRACMVATPANYPWSSHGFNARGIPSTMLVPHEQYLALGLNADERTENYRRLFDKEMSEEEIQEIRDAVNGGFVLGREAFAAGIERILGARAVRGIGGRPKANQHARL
jgi:putative transposase